MNPIDMKTHVDHPDIAEVFADGVKMVMISDGIVRVELCASRLDEPRPPSRPTGKTHTAARLAITIPAAIALQDYISRNLAELEKQGMLKRGVAPPSTPTEPKH